jgi:hypothetical protein
LLLDLATQSKFKFDRIDFSNLGDENYIGLKKLLLLSKPVMNTCNPSAKIMSILLNWLAGTEFHGMTEKMNQMSAAYHPKPFNK